MKKILALTLAAVMAAGMTTVAFADKDDNLVFGGYDLGSLTVFYDEDGKNGIDNTKNSDDATNLDTLSKKDAVAGGTELYLPIYDKGTKDYVTDEDVIDDWKVATTWTLNKADKATIEQVKINGKYIYAVKVVLPEAAEDKGTDLAGEIVIYSNTYKKNDAGFSRTAKISLTYGYKSEDFDTADSNGFDNAAIVRFEDNNGDDIDDVVEMDFGEYMTFEVDVTGQGKLNLKNNTKFVSEIADLDKSANMDFITFEKSPSFNKIGTAYIYAADDTYLYEVVDGKLVAVDADYNEDYEAWEFKTRTLGQYVISDKELDLETINTEVDDKDDASSTTEDGNKQNPDTGR